MLIFATLTIIVAFLYWMGIQVETGRRKPQPQDLFFPIFGRNIDYVIGTAGILVGTGIIIEALGLSVDSYILIGVGVGCILAGIIRPYLSPKKFGPRWIKKVKL